jgi:hypothetical protein
MRSMKEDVHIRISEDVMRRVRAWAGRYEISLAAAIGFLLSNALDAEGES